MGCDIHMHIEVMVAGRWEHYAAPSIERWYKLFGLMAGVRNHEVTPICSPKGFPADASIVTKLIYEDEKADAHTVSWLDHDEIIKLEDTLEEWSKESDEKWPQYDLEYGILHTYLSGNSFTAHWRYDDCRYLPEGIDDIRFVFWFDN